MVISAKKDLTNPFNMQKFRENMELLAKSFNEPNYLGIDVHKNSPTILYL
jgi:hypothetical protein